ncbi:MAG: DUF58 domain-containing protein [Planctomycetes bacterium]|nr:DUF58 domain-containing protein [Planctomycetota bacterium]
MADSPRPEFEIGPELFARVRQIQLRTRRAVSNALAGAYKSTFRGSGLEFDTVREYEVGDDIRSIDWKVTARTDKPHIKTFVEERQLSLVLLVDASASMDFGSVRATKRELSAELVALLGQVAIVEQDQVALAGFGGARDAWVPPARSPSLILRLVRDVLAAEPAREPGRDASADLARALEELAMRLRRRAMVFLVSDWLLPLDSASRETWLKPLGRLARRHDVIAVRVHDPLEEALPSAGLVSWLDAETGRRVEIDTSSSKLRAAWAASANVRRMRWLEDMGRSGLGIVELSTHKSPVDPVVRFFQARTRRGGRR